jgi:hypothetical protein
MTRPAVLFASVTEEEFQAHVIRLSTMFGWLTYHTRDSRRSASGFPDLVLVRGPRLIFAELKSVNGKVRDSQADWLTRLRDTKAEVYLWRPNDIDEITEILRG